MLAQRMSMVSVSCEVLRYRLKDGTSRIGSHGLLAPDPCGGAIGTAGLPSDDASIVDLSRQHARTVPHQQSTLRAHGAFPVIWRGPDDPVCDCQRKRNAVFPTSDIIARGSAARQYRRCAGRCNPMPLSRYARIRTVEHRCRRSRSLRGNRHCQGERGDYQPDLEAEGRHRLTSLSPSRHRWKEWRPHHKLP
jgi:hypothetical protein